jgi:undecaprenyl-phosphate 4-deoxy-4-formamido-L-arabinose transferase
MPTVSAVIPVYNSAQSLKALHQALTLVLQASAEDYEIIFVEDCGKDNSWQIIESLCALDNHTKGIKLSRNYGQHNALLCGIRQVQYEIVVTLDDDLQNPPSEIPKLLSQLSNEVDVVYGTPQSEKHGLLRNLASVLTKIALQKGMGVEAARSVSAFRAFRTKLRDGFATYQGPFVSIDVLLTWSTSRFKAIPVLHESRAIGQSNYTFGKLFNHAFNMLTGFSTVPLQVASLMGFLFMLFGIGILVWVIGRYFMLGGSIPGFPFLASIISIFSGVQLFALGVFGEYLARIHFRTMDKPSYVVAAKVTERSAQETSPGE